MLTPKFDELVKQLQVLPSVGQKSAQRMALYLLSKKRQQGIQLADALQTAMLEIQECDVCHSFSDKTTCRICADVSRDERLLCVVEQASDILAIEQSGYYRGRYFVLGGYLSPIDGVMASDLNIDQLVFRLQKEPIKELILATSATIQGQTTAYFIQEIAKPYVTTISKLAQGIPMGGELGFMDGMTLAQALQNRTLF